MISTHSFAGAVLANLNYWYQQVLELNESQYYLLESDWPNIIRAVRYGLGLSGGWPATVQLALEVFFFVERRGYWNEWIPLLERLRESADTEFPKLCASLLEQLGSFNRLRRNLAEAIRLHQEAEIILREHGDLYQVARVCQGLSEDFRLERQYDEAERYGLMALDLFEHLGFATNAGKGGVVLNTLGMIAQARGELQLAQKRLVQALSLFRQTNIPTELGRTLKNLANVLEAQGETDMALECLMEASAIFSVTTNELEKAMVNISLSNLYFNRGQFKEAEVVLRSTNLAFLEQMGHSYYHALALNNLGNVFLKQGQLPEASQCLNSSIALWRQINDEVMLGNTLGTLGETLIKLVQLSPAYQAYEEALLLLGRHPDDSWAAYLAKKFEAQRQALAAKPD